MRLFVSKRLRLKGPLLWLGQADSANEGGQSLEGRRVEMHEKDPGPAVS